MEFVGLLSRRFAMEEEEVDWDPDEPASGPKMRWVDFADSDLDNDSVEEASEPGPEHEPEHDIEDKSCSPSLGQRMVEQETDGAGNGL